MSTTNLAFVKPKQLGIKSQSQHVNQLQSLNTQSKGNCHQLHTLLENVMEETSNQINILSRHSACEM